LAGGSKAITTRCSGAHQDQGAVAAVFAEAVRPRDAGIVEGLVKYPVELLVQVQADVVVAVRPGESGDVDREQGAELAVSRRGGPRFCGLGQCHLRSPQFPP
jgi:hypothetical protein